MVEDHVANFANRVGPYPRVDCGEVLGALNPPGVERVCDGLVKGALFESGRGWVSRSAAAERLWDGQLPVRL